MKDGAEQTSPLFRAWVAARRPFKVDSPFFAAGNVERELVAKQVLHYLCFSLPCLV